MQIDCSHGNSSKQHQRQIVVGQDIVSDLFLRGQAYLLPHHIPTPLYFRRSSRLHNVRMLICIGQTAHVRPDLNNDHGCHD